MKSLAHRDLKPENMMINKDGALVLCDFGVSQFFTHHNSKRDVVKGEMGTRRFMAPECFNKTTGKVL